MRGLGRREPAWLGHYGGTLDADRGRLIYLHLECRRFWSNGPTVDGDSCDMVLQ
jgi:hypothetical protein